MEQPFFQEQFVESQRIIYTASQFAKTNLLYLQEAGSLTAQKIHENKRSNLASYLVFIVLKGSGTLLYEQQEYTLNMGDVVFIDCHKPYCHRTSDDLWCLRWVHFYGANMNSIYQKYRTRGGSPCFHAKDVSSYTSILTNLETIAQSDSNVRDMKIYEFLTKLLTMMIEENWDKQTMHYSTSQKRNLQDVKLYLDEHYNEKISLEFLSEHFFINKFYLTRLFKDQFGDSITNYLIKIRITQAKQLLRFSDLSISEIAQKCGMNDANYFSRIFKKVEGCTPGEFRKLW